MPAPTPPKPATAGAWARIAAKASFGADLARGAHRGVQRGRERSRERLRPEFGGR
jgi:hypothetical protein